MAPQQSSPGRSERLAQKLAALPDRPGVYLMKDSEGRILYVGKAKVLRHRVRSYFQQIDPRTQPKVAALVAHLDDFDYVITHSEVEALILEGNLIKEHKPRYNVLLKDDKAFPFIKITNEPFPQVVVTRQITKDGARYFGPYTDVKAMRRTLDLIRRVFPLRTCTNAKLWPSLDRPCLDYYIHRCPGPCKEHITQEDYRELVNQVCQFLSGKTADLVHRLQDRMHQASQTLQFEFAARLRDQVQAIQGAVIKQRVVTYEDVDRDIIGFARDGPDVCMVVLQVREGKLLGKEHFFLSALEEAPGSEVVGSFLTQYYLTAQLIPGELLLPCDPDDADAVRDWLTERRSARVAVTVPQRGDKASLVDLAARNAELQLREHLLRRVESRDRVPAAVLALQRDLRLQTPPRRIEAFDISNLQGTDPVASMVCFVDGRARKSEYRKFLIKEVIGPNDFAMMREVVGRRYRRLLDDEQSLPDLVLIDGGKGQLSSAKKVLDELGLIDLPVIGLAKRLEEIYVPDQSDPILIPKTSSSLRLLIQVRDEAHRFAVTFHQERRGKRMILSELDRIPGIGAKRRQTLLRQFGSVERIRQCSLEELAAAPGVGDAAAAKLYAHFHPAEALTQPES